MNRAMIPQVVIPAIAIVAIAIVPVARGAEEGPLFEDTVLPVFKAKCAGCHGVKQLKGELNLMSIDGVLEGGESGAAFDADSPGESLLLEMIRDDLMPPEKSSQLTKAEKRAIERWVVAGAQSKHGHRGALNKSPTMVDVIPLMLRRCVMCHGAELRLGDVDLRSHVDLTKQLVAGKPDESLVVKRIVDKACPPTADIGEAGIEPATADELELLREWIRTGAQAGDLNADVATRDGDPLVSDGDRDFWSFRKPVKTAVPNMALAAAGAQNPIDAYLHDRLTSKGLAFSPRASRSGLVRRATFALTGLPPTKELLERFGAEEGSEPFSKLVDELLASPQYGEKWGRFWLDLAGYADSEGKRNADMIRGYAWRYRDWVIRAINDDMPYDRFLLEQIAGDELVDWANEDAVTDDVIQTLIATGFMRMAPDGTSADPVNRFPDRLEVISDEVDVLGRSVMGLTLNCARCHSHKYDPIPQRDYYRLLAVFKGAYDEYNWRVPQKFNNQWNKATARHLDVQTPDDRAKHEAHNQPIQAKIAELQKQLKGKLDAKQKKALQADVKKLQAELQQPQLIRALWDNGQPSPAFIYRRGNETTPGRLVGPGVPSVLTDGRTPFAIEPPQHSSPKTGRRLALAKWLTSPDHPLTARVFVNRIWQQHFGRGIVESVDNFGKLGTRPSHPKLLDWLAVEFVENGWSLKRLHRQILMTKVWQQSSAVTAEHERLDPDNRLLSRMRMRRLSAEELRDCVMSIAGVLDLTPFGPPDEVEVRKDGLVTSKPKNGKWRRSIYVRQRRKEMPTLFETFDLPQMNPNCSERKISTIVTQPLVLLNNRLIHDLAGKFAERVIRGADNGNRDEAVSNAYELVFNRRATDVELETARLALAEFQKHWTAAKDDAPNEKAMADLCHAFLNSANLLYVD